MFLVVGRKFILAKASSSVTHIVSVRQCQKTTHDEGILWFGVGHTSCQVI